MKKVATKKIQLTDDPIVNIHMMVPLLDDEGREAISNMMFGYYLSESIRNRRKEEPSKAVELAT